MQLITIALRLHSERQVASMAKKIVLVIVEGPSDDTALGMLLDNYFDPKTVKVHVVHGDITTQTSVNEIVIFSFTLVFLLSSIVISYSKYKYTF